MRVILLVLLLINLLGCEIFWVRSSTVPYTNSLFPACAYAAIEKTGGLRVISHLTSEGLIVGRSDFSQFQIVKNEFNNLEIVLLDTARIPEKHEKEINILLSLLTKNVLGECNAS